MMVNKIFNELKQLTYVLVRVLCYLWICGSYPPPPNIFQAVCKKWRKGQKGWRAEKKRRKGKETGLKRNSPIKFQDIIYVSYSANITVEQSFRRASAELG